MALTKAHSRMIEGAAVNVVDFGAVGDGVTDDTAAIQAAIDSLPSGGNILFSFGTYLISDYLSLYSNQTIDLNGSTVKQKDASNIGNFGLFHCSSVNDVVIKNGSINGNGANQTTYPWSGIKATSSNRISVENMYIYDCVGDNVSDGQIAGIWLFESSYCKINNCYIKNSNNNMLLHRASYCTIENIIFEDNTRSEALSVYKEGGDIPTLHNTITNCTFKNCRQGLGILGGKYTTVSNCSFDNSSNHAILVRNGPTSISNCQIKQGASAADVAISIGQEDPDDDATYEFPIEISNVSVDLNGRDYDGFRIALSSPSKTTLVNCKVFNSTGSGITNADGFNIQASTNVKLIGCYAEGLDIGFEVGGLRSKDLSFIDCVAVNNRRWGLLFDASSITFANVIGGTYKNNSQASAGAYTGILVNSTNNYNVTIKDVSAYDDQDTPTQGITGISPSSKSGNPINSSSAPTEGFYRIGDQAWRRTPTAGNKPGFVVINRVDTEVRVAWSSGTTLEVDSTSGILANDVIGLQMDNGTYHFTTVASITDGDTLEMTSAPSSSSAAINNNVITYRWRDMAALSP